MSTQAERDQVHADWVKNNPNATQAQKDQAERDRMAGGPHPSPDSRPRNPDGSLK